MAESWLDQYRDEIVTLYRDERLTQAEIRRLMEQKYTINIPKTTLSNYLKQQPESRQRPAPGELRITPEEEQFFAQRELFEFLKQADEQIIEQLVRLIARMGTLEDGAEARHQHVLSHLPSADRHEQITQALVALTQQRDGQQTPRVFGVQLSLKWTIITTVLVTSLAWLLGLVYFVRPL